MNQSTPNILVVGESLVDLFPTSSIVPSEGYEWRPGGAPANVAVGLSRLGREPDFWSLLGADPFGTALADTLTTAGVSDKYIQQRDTKNTGLAFVEADGAFRFYLQNTATIDFAVSMVSDDLLEGIEWVHIGGTLLATAARDAICEIAKRASERQCTVSFDPNFREPLITDPEAMQDLFNEVWTYADVVKLTEEDLRQIGLSTQFIESHKDDPLAPHTIVRTRGSRGASLYSTATAPWGRADICHDGFSIDTVEETGAGDAFTAALIDRLLMAEHELIEVLEFASAAGAITTTRTGAMSVSPDRESIRLFLEAQT